MCRNWFYMVLVILFLPCSSLFGSQINPTRSVAEADFLGQWNVVAYIDGGNRKLVHQCGEKSKLLIEFSKIDDNKFKCLFLCDNTPSPEILLINDAQQLGNMKYTFSDFLGKFVSYVVKPRQWLLFPTPTNKNVMIITGPSQKKFFIVSKTGAPPVNLQTVMQLIDRLKIEPKNNPWTIRTSALP